MRPRLAPVLFAALAATSSLCLPTRLALAQGGPAGQAPKPALTPPALQKFVDADYPPDAMKERIEGTVVLQLDIDADGKVTGATVLNPAGHGFDEAALAASRRFEFQPALRNNKPVPSRIVYRYTFTLKPVEPPLPDGSTPGAATPAAKRSVLRGTVNIGGSSEPLQGARVKIKGAEGAPLELTTGADGSWLINDLPPGKYQVSVESAGYEPLSVEEEVSLGQSTEVIYRLRPKGDGFEVVIKGERPPREVTKRTLEQRELSRIPGTNGDALRAIQNMPGVARPPGLAGLLIVRGSAPQDTQVFVNGTLIPLVYHFGGLTSVVPTEMIERLDFFPGNFSTQYGRVMGGIVDVGIRSPKQDGKYHALAQADFIDARVLAEGPVPFLKNFTFIAGARRSYVDVWLKPVLESAGSGVTTAPVYYDYQAFVETRPTSASRVRVGVYGSSDALEILIKNPSAQDPTLGGDIGLRTTFWRAQAEYNHDLTDRLRVRSVLAYGLDAINFNLGSLYFKLTTRPLSNRLEFAYRVAKGVTVNVGQDVQYATFDIDLRVPQPPRPGEPNSGPFTNRPPLVLSQSGSFYRPAAFVEAELVPNERVRLVPGIRADYSKDIESWSVSPRVNGRYVVNNEFPKTTLKGGVGVFHQPPQPQETSRIFGSPGLTSNRAIHYAFGAEQQITKQVEISVEGFYKQLDSLVARTQTVAGTQYNNLGTGAVVGSEILLRYKPDARFFGWLAYTLSRSTRKAGPDQPTTRFQYDQTHILTAIGSYRLGRGWEFGARFRIISGSLATPCLGGIQNSSAGSYSCISGEAFSQRLPMFHQLDLRLDKRWQFQDWRMSTYLDLLNVYNHGNVEALDYNYNYTQVIYQTGLPLIPSVGVRGEF
jgi:TonB family protein